MPHNATVAVSVLAMQPNLVCCLLCCPLLHCICILCIWIGEALKGRWWQVECPYRGLRPLALWLCGFMAWIKPLDVCFVYRDSVWNSYLCLVCILLDSALSWKITCSGTSFARLAQTLFFLIAPRVHHLSLSFNPWETGPTLQIFISCFTIWMPANVHNHTFCGVNHFLHSALIIINAMLLCLAYAPASCVTKICKCRNLF